MRDKGLKRKLDVYLRDDLVGRLWLDERRRFVFQYDAAWLKGKSPIPLSLSLPLKAEPYLDDMARPFFSNLLPEAGIRQTIARRLRISEQNDYDLLREIGGECAGAVSVLPEGSVPSLAPGYREIDEEELQRLVKELPRRPFLVGEKGMRLSLAGAQTKLPIYLEGNRVFLATGNADAHAKNLAIIYTPLGPRLAPFYDLISTLVYPGLSARLAMRIGGENRLNWIQQRHWERLSREVGIKPRWIEKMVREISQSISPLADSVAHDFMETCGPSAIVEKVVGIIKRAALRFGR